MGLAEPDLDRLVTEAWEARRGAYAPYSGFEVGAAVLAGDEVFRGANVENASYPVGVCAERVAASRAVSSGNRHITAVAVTAAGSDPTPPCGMCRQFLFEFNPEMTVVSEGAGGTRTTWRLADLLTDAFGRGSLGQGG